jgi:hypothetical protein
VPLAPDLAPTIDRKCNQFGVLNGAQIVPHLVQIVEDCAKRNKQCVWEVTHPLRQEEDPLDE